MLTVNFNSLQISCFDNITEIITECQSMLWTRRALHSLHTLPGIVLIIIIIIINLSLTT